MTGNVNIPDPELRKRFAAAHLAAGASPKRFGLLMATAA
jgi:cystathionine beta-lyase